MTLYTMAAEAAKKQAQRESEVFEATISKLLSERLTDRKVADDLRSNLEGLAKAGIEPDISHLRYVKLAACEDEQERRALTQVNYDHDEWYE